MLSFKEMNRLVSEVFEKHSQGVRCLFGDAARAYRAEKNSVLVANGWDPESFDEKVEEYASDYEVWD